MGRLTTHRIDVPEGESVSVEFVYKGKVVAEAMVEDIIHEYPGTEKKGERRLDFRAGPVEVDRDGERHGADDGGGDWTLTHLGEIVADRFARP